MLGISILGMVSCENSDVEFEDFGMTTVCFPYQTPARSLILGRYDQGFNDNDNKHCFEVGVSLSGLYENKENRKVYFEVDESLLEGVTNVEALPSSYYTLSDEGCMVIPRGDFKGRVKVQLSDEFFRDAKGVAPLNKTHYVLPLRITGVEGIDSVLMGVPVVANPHLAKKSDWSEQPKNYVLYGIKYINSYDGYFLRRGADRFMAWNGTGYEQKDEVVYRQKYVEKDELVRLTTDNLKVANVPTSLRRSGVASKHLNIKIDFSADDNTCIVRSWEGNEIGKGRYVADGDAWGGRSRDVIYLDYSLPAGEGKDLHHICDTLVMRDRDVKFEQFSVEF